MVTIIALSTFICITFAVMAIYWFVFHPQSSAAERLEQLSRQRSVESIAVQSGPDENRVAMIAEKVAEPLSRIVPPPSAAEAKKLQKKLMEAGYRSENAPLIYRSVQLTSMIGFPGAVALLWMIMAWPLSSIITWLLVAFLAGFFMPRYVLNRMIRSRQQRLRWGLADALDLMVVSVEAGLGLNAAMLRVSGELKDVHPDISEEFEMANLEIRVGREREEALRNLAERTGVDDLRSLVAMLIQADRFGTSITKAIRVYSESIRTKRRQRAEQAAQKAAVKLLFPLACFLFPTLFIFLLGPAMLTLQDILGDLVK